MKAQLIGKMHAFLNKSRRRGLGYSKAVLIYYARRGVHKLYLKVAGEAGYNSRFELCWQRMNLGLSSSGIGGYFDDRCHPVFHFSSVTAAAVAQSIPDRLKEEAVEEADRVLTRRFKFRNITLTAPREIDWNAAPQDSESWRWDLNRHCYFLDLCTAFFYTGDRRYLDEVVNLWQQWIKANPLERSLAWTSPFEVAARLSNWIWTFFYLTSSPFADELPLKDLLRSMHHHGLFLYRNLELHWPNNHLLLESKALLTFALLFPELDPGTRALRRAETIFNRELVSQILPDGAHSELCTMYHRVVSGELHELAMLARRNGNPLSAFAEQKLAAMRCFSQALARSDGSMPLTGDSAADDNYIRFHPEGRWQSHLDYWMAAGGGGAKVEEVAKEEFPLVKIFPSGGYGMIADRWAGQDLHLWYDFGSFSMNPATDHAHCDALSFDLHACGRSLLVDPGVLYHPHLRHFHGYFRSTAAHNTVSLDGLEQSQLWRASDVKQRSTVRFLGAVAAPGEIAIKGSCIPFWGKKVGICHHREMAYRTFGQLKILDRIEGRGLHLVTWSFHFGPELTISSPEPGMICGVDEHGNRVIELQCGNTYPVEIVHGRQDPPLGWYSADSSTVTPISVALFTSYLQLPTACEFLIRVGPSRQGVRR